MLAEGGGRGSPLESVVCRVLHAVLGEKSFPTRPMRVGLSTGTSKCPGMLKHPSANRLEHLSSLTENSDMVVLPKRNSKF